MSESTLKPGQVVLIYEKPFSNEDCEGEATLVRFIQIWDHDCEYWEVCFLSDGSHVCRLVNPINLLICEGNASDE